jgi:hypothetical protein
LIRVRNRVIEEVGDELGLEVDKYRGIYFRKD